MISMHSARTHRARHVGWRAAVAVGTALLVASSATAADEEAPAPGEPARKAPRSEERPRHRDRGWEPQVLLGFAVHSQELRGRTESFNPDTDTDKTNPLRFSIAEAELALYTPVLLDNDYAPRLLLRAGGQVPFTDKHVAFNTLSTFNTGEDLARFEANCPIPPNQSTDPRGPFRSAFCEVRGRNDVIVNGSVFAGLGFDVALPFSEYQFHVRPSLNYFAQTIEGEGIITRTTASGTTTGLDFDQRDEVRGKADAKWIHGLGPRLELNIEVARVGDLVFEFMIQTAIYWMLTDRKLEFDGRGVTGEGLCRQGPPNTQSCQNEPGDPPPGVSPPGTYPVPGGQPLTSRFQSEVGPYIVQGGGGFRVSWRGLAL